jgi:hypothetical protein
MLFILLLDILISDGIQNGNWLGIEPRDPLREDRSTATVLQSVL